MRIFSRSSASPPASQQPGPYLPDIVLNGSLAKNLEMLNPFIEKSVDVVNRGFLLDGGDIAVQVIYLNGVPDPATLHEHILKPLINNDRLSASLKHHLSNPIQALASMALEVGSIKTVARLPDLVHSIYDGMVVIMVDGSQSALSVDIHGGQVRAVEEPPGEKGTRGARDGFVESLDINIALVRRRFRDPRLVVEKTMVGQRSRTPVALLFVEDVAAPEIVQEVRDRLARINTDVVQASGFVEQFIEDNPYSVFPQMWTSERPDKVLPNLSEGRVAIIVDGTPTILYAPGLFVQFMQASEDYMQRVYTGSYIRALRFLAFFTAISLPAVYISLLSFQPELLPIDLMVSLAQARKEVPFPVVVETLIQEVIIQIVVEAGMRMPQPIAQTTGVVAGIILGQAAISAKLASPGVIVIIAITTICTFALPNQPIVDATRVLRLPLLLLSSTMGLFGFSMGWLFILAHLAGLESFGTAYFSPLAPMRYQDIKDSFIRSFMWKMDRRPASIPTQDKVRQGSTRGEDPRHG